MAGARMTETPTPDPAALGEFLRTLRARADPARFASVGAVARSGARGVTQAQAAEAVGMTEGWWRRIESAAAVLEIRYVDRVVEAFGLTGVERMILHRLSQGWEPVSAPRSEMLVPQQTRVLLDGLPWPAYVSDPAWDILAANRHVTEWFPTVRAGSNVMVEAVTDTASRERLHDWERCWARPMLGQLRAARLSLPEVYVDRLSEVIARILAESPAAAAVWERYPHTLYVHPDGAVRPVLLPPELGGLRLVRLSASELAGFPYSRLMVFTPVNVDRPVRWPHPDFPFELADG